MFFVSCNLLLFLLSASSSFSTAICAAEERDFAERAASSSWPYGPFTTSGRNIVDSRGNTVTFVGVNWPLNLETMIPEGLEYRSASSILSDLSGLGFNFIRMGYAIEMIDQLYETQGSDVSILDSLTSVLGSTKGLQVAQQIVANNPSWTVNTGRLHLWGDIVNQAAQYQIFVHPDVHVGKATWCCSHTDGNAYFNDVNFNTGNWTRGLQYMAAFARSYPSIVSMSLRNELRASWLESNTDYNWVTLVGNFTAATNAIYNANPDLLVTWSGLNFDHDLSALTSGLNLQTATCNNCSTPGGAATYFDLDSYPWANKVVWELHIYQNLDYNGASDTDCDTVNTSLYYNGANALGIAQPSGCSQLQQCHNPVRITPVIISEFGGPMNSAGYNSQIQRCLQNFTVQNKVSWAMWVMAGSYRYRQGVQDFDETWGLYNKDWSGWRDPQGITSHWKPWISAMKN